MRYMRYTFTESIRSALAQAVREADALRHAYLGTEHILLALLREGSGPASTILAALKVDRDDVRSRALEELRPGNQVEPMGERPYSPGARRVLEHAMASADELEESSIDTDHLLIGLTAVEEEAARTLAAVGVTAAAVIREARRLRG